MTDLVITESDVRSFQSKLEQWGADLSDGEGAILQLVLVRAFPDGASAEPEVEGFADQTPHPSGKAKPHDFTFTHLYDKSSPVLHQACHVESLVGIHVTVLGGPSL